MIAEAALLRDVYTLTVPERQFLPLGFPGTTASLGGLLVTNTSGVKRARYGGMRDSCRCAGSTGRRRCRAVWWSGGKKCRRIRHEQTFVGSLGVFGVVLETTYAWRPLPEDDRMLAMAFPTLSQATAAAAAIQGSQLLPSALTIVTAEVAAACLASLGAAFANTTGGAPGEFRWHARGGRTTGQGQSATLSAARQYGRSALTDVNLLHVWEFPEA